MKITVNYVSFKEMKHVWTHQQIELSNHLLYLAQTELSAKERPLGKMSNGFQQTIEKQREIQISQ